MKKEKAATALRVAAFLFSASAKDFRRGAKVQKPPAMRVD